MKSQEKAAVAKSFKRAMAKSGLPLTKIEEIMQQVRSHGTVALKRLPRKVLSRIRKGLKTPGDSVIVTWSRGTGKIVVRMNSDQVVRNQKPFVHWMAKLSPEERSAKARAIANKRYAKKSNGHWTQNPKHREKALAHVRMMNAKKMGGVKDNVAS